MLMPHTIKLNADGPVFEHAGTDTLLRAALRAGVGFPYECSSGGCGACMYELVEGEIDDLWPQAPGLSAQARQRGLRLACQTRPLSDCRARVRLKGANAPVIRPQRQRARLMRRESLTHDMIEFHFQTQAPAEFRAGQYALLDLPGVQGSRAYSMSNLANGDGRWSFIVKRMPGGRGSAALFEQLRKGSEIGLDGPYGNAYFRDDSPRDIVCIAGGSGLSPVISILSAAMQGFALAGRRITLFYGGRRPEDLCAEAIVQRDSVMHRHVSCVNAISDANFTDWEGERGYIHEVVKRFLGTQVRTQESDFYFCGPPPMTDAVQKLLLLEYHVPASRLFFDRFL